ncbi:MAG: DUF4145 domain-containing protein [Rhodobacteraceae bacterium]|nr:DUF4145 domain-containing protein [Paracoccaceae bacterium]
MNKPPAFGEIRFSCPHCGALAHQYWASTRFARLDKDVTPSRFVPDKIEELILKEDAKSTEDRNFSKSALRIALRAANGDVLLENIREHPYSYRVFNLDISKCDSCEEISVWLLGKLIFPPSGLANTDMPEKVKLLFDEAGSVFQASLRAAAALLRLALQHLLHELTQKDQKIDTAINDLIDRGLDDELSKLMHSLRIIGNEAVHPGTIDIDDEPEMAEAMFSLLNEIVDQMISKPARHKALWEKLPENKRKPVEQKLAKRDEKKE